MVRVWFSDLVKMPTTAELEKLWQTATIALYSTLGTAKFTAVVKENHPFASSTYHTGAVVVDIMLTGQNNTEETAHAVQAITQAPLLVYLSNQNMFTSTHVASCLKQDCMADLKAVQFHQSCPEIASAHFVGPRAGKVMVASAYLPPVLATNQDECAEACLVDPRCVAYQTKLTGANRCDLLSNVTSTPVANARWQYYLRVRNCDRKDAAGPTPAARVTPGARVTAAATIESLLPDENVTATAATPPGSTVDAPLPSNQRKNVVFVSAEEAVTNPVTSKTNDSVGSKDMDTIMIAVSICMIVLIVSAFGFSHIQRKRYNGRRGDRKFVTDRWEFNVSDNSSSAYPVSIGGQDAFDDDLTWDGSGLRLHSDRDGTCDTDGVRLGNGNKKARRTFFHGDHRVQAAEYDRIESLGGTGSTEARARTYRSTAARDSRRELRYESGRESTRPQYNRQGTLYRNPTDTTSLYSVPQKGRAGRHSPQDHFGLNIPAPLAEPTYAMASPSGSFFSPSGLANTGKRRSTAHEIYDTASNRNTPHYSLIDAGDDLRSPPLAPTRHNVTPLPAAYHLSLPINSPEREAAAELAAAQSAALFQQDPDQFLATMTPEMRACLSPDVRARMSPDSYGASNATIYDTASPAISPVPGHGGQSPNLALQRLLGKFDANGQLIPQAGHEDHEYEIMNGGPSIGGVAEDDTEVVYEPFYAENTIPKATIQIASPARSSGRVLGLTGFKSTKSTS